jgi:hypothetical protein
LLLLNLETPDLLCIADVRAAAQFHRPLADLVDRDLAAILVSE